MPTHGQSHVFAFILGMLAFGIFLPAAVFAVTCQEAVNQVSSVGDVGICLTQPNPSNAFNGTEFFSLAKVQVSCDGQGESCYVSPASLQTSYYCSQLGKLKGVTDAVCKNGSACPEGQTALASDANADPCVDAGGPRTCCTASAIGSPAAGATTAAAVSEKGITRTSFGLKNPLGRRTVPQILGSVVGWLGTFAGGLFMLYLIWGGIQWMAAGGSTEQVEAGRKKIIAAVSGIVVILLSYLIVDAVISFTTIRQ